MSLEPITPGYYKEFAEQAANLEQQAHWKEAALHWEQAEKKAQKTSNRNWAVHRKEFCRSQMSRFYM